MGTPVRETAFPTRAKDVTADASDTVNLIDHEGKNANMTLQSIDGGVLDVLPAGNAEGDTVTFTLAAGDFIPVLVKRLLATGLTSTEVIGFWSS